MKILLRRKKRKHNRMVVVCRSTTCYGTKGCEAVLLIKAKDIVCVHTKNNGIEYRFICPECGQFTRIDPKDIPLPMRYKVSPMGAGPNNRI